MEICLYGVGCLIYTWLDSLDTIKGNVSIIYKCGMFNLMVTGLNECEKLIIFVSAQGVGTFDGYNTLLGRQCVAVIDLHGYEDPEEQKEVINRLYPKVPKIYYDRSIGLIDPFEPLSYFDNEV